MRLAYLDCVGGISGDMFVGALLDAGWPEAALREAVAWLGAEIAELRVETRSHQGLQGRGILVRPAAEAAHHHRGPRDIERLLQEAPLADEVRAKALTVFQRLAEAEARAHGAPLEEIHFHEVGAVDALVDIVGTCAGMTQLGIERLFVSPLPLGKGETVAAHGRIPLPAPATAFLLEGVPVHWTEIEGEHCTPTGVALARALGEWSPPPAMRVQRVGSGAGTRSFADRPNLARLFIGEALAVTPAEGPGPGPGHPRGAGLADLPPWGWGAAADPADATPGVWGRIVALETLVDDATPESIALLSEELRARGALEVEAMAVQGKKGRLATRLSVIGRPEQEERLAGHLLRQGSTLGVRRRLEWRRELERRSAKVTTPFGAVRVKLALRGERWVGEPEFESCRALAAQRQVGFREVWRAALAALERVPAEPAGRRESQGREGAGPDAGDGTCVDR